MTSNRCLSFGNCKPSNNSTYCTSFSNSASGTSCGTCQTCNGIGTCNQTPTDDSACGVIDCDGLDTTCRNYNDLTSSRCEGFGNCKDPNTTDCTIYSNASSGTVCGAWSSCSYSSCTNWTGSVNCTRTGGTQNAPACNGGGSCSSSVSQGCPDSACPSGSCCSGGSCGGSSESCNGYDDDCDGSIDEGLDDGYEQNDTLSNATSLGAWSDCNNFTAETRYANILPNGDDDWYVSYVTDNIGCSLYPQAIIDNLPADYDLYVFYECPPPDGPNGTQIVSCDSANDWACQVTIGSYTYRGCCSNNSGTSSEQVIVNPNCPSSSNDTGWVYIWVDPFGSVGSCSNYRLRHGY